jgi:hypothetical protein
MLVDVGVLMTDDEYRLEQEKWVSNCTGGSISEINQVSASLAVCSKLNSDDIRKLLT